MHGIRRLVEIALYGVGDQRRYVQDGAVFPEVWISILESGGQRIPVLVQPYLELAPPKLASELGKRDITRRTHQLVFSNTLVSLKADLETLVFGLSPLTGWFTKNSSQECSEEPDGFVDSIVEVLDSSSLWADLPLGIDDSNDLAQRKELFSFVRICGVVKYFLQSSDSPRGIRENIEAFIASTRTEAPEHVMSTISSYVKAGWANLLETKYANSSRPAKLIYSITNDRDAYLAISDSTRTTKADAAARLFGVSCRNVTWAIIDSGIDANHPAFARDKADVRPGRPHTRVIRTFDFTRIRELLLGIDDDAATAPEMTKATRDLLTKVRRRAESFHPIDWGLMLPLLEIDATNYVAPKNGHGTHVAGILGGHWLDAPRDPMVGMCPDINLIDLRVCRPDGSSDEFIVTSALQFVRYLNAHADMMAVHGVNLSLSLEHDVSNYACGRTPVCLEAERTMSSGVIVVAAAGNRGYRHIKAADESTFYQFCAVSITDPGNAEGVITVGSTHRREPHNFGVSYFSSRGPTGDGRSKPDLVAPGEKIYGPAPNGDAMTLDGTSMAAPHVSGAAAMLIARHPELVSQPARVKKVLCDSATDLGREKYFQGAGLVDVLRALQSV